MLKIYKNLTFFLKNKKINAYFEFGASNYLKKVTFS